MSEAAENIEQEAVTYTQEQFTALEAENASMKSKMDELLGETKRAKAARREADELAQQAANEAAAKKGDFQQLHKSSEEQRAKLQEELDGLKAGIATEKRDNEAMRLAVELADGVNAELLSTFIQPRLKHTSEGVKILDSKGQLTVSTVEDLKAEFQNNERFKALLKGNQSSGGGAIGGKSGSAANNVISRSDFDKLAPIKRMEFVKSKGKIVD